MRRFFFNRNAQVKVDKVVLWGACASRDALPDKKSLDYQLNYLHRSSMAALLSIGTDEFEELLDEADEGIKIPSELKAAKRDCKANWDLEAEFADCDLLIIDLVAERAGIFTKKQGEHDLVISGEGRYKKTITDAIVERGYQKRFGYSTDDGFIELLTKGMGVFLEAAKKSGAKIVLNEVYCAEKFDDGSETNPWANSINERLGLFNATFKKLAKERKIKLFVVTYDKDKEAIARKHGHRWGPGAFHFVPDYYELFAKRIWDEFRIKIR